MAVTQKPLTLTTENNLPEITGKIENGEFVLRAGNFRFLVIADGGGHWEVKAPGSVPAEQTKLVVNGTGHVTVTEE